MGLTTVALSHKGEGNFAVVGYSDAGADLIANDIDSYGGDTLLSDGTYLIEVTAGGSWSITPG